MAKNDTLRLVTMGDDGGDDGALHVLDIVEIDMAPADTQRRRVTQRRLMLAEVEAQIDALLDGHIAELHVTASGS